MATLKAATRPAPRDENLSPPEPTPLTPSAYRVRKDLGLGLQRCGFPSHRSRTSLPGLHLLTTSSIPDFVGGAMTASHSREAGQGVAETPDRWQTHPSQHGSISWVENEPWLQLPPPPHPHNRRLCGSAQRCLVGSMDRKQKGCLATAFCPGPPFWGHPYLWPFPLLKPVCLPTSSVSTNGAPSCVRPVPGVCCTHGLPLGNDNLPGLTRPTFTTK